MCNACRGLHSDSLYSGSEHRQFNSPRLVKREAGFPNPRRALIGSNQLWRVNDSPYYREYQILPKRELCACIVDVLIAHWNERSWFDNISAIGCVGGCHFDNSMCTQWQKFCQNYIFVEISSANIIGHQTTTSDMTQITHLPYKPPTFVSPFIPSSLSCLLSSLLFHFPALSLIYSLLSFLSSHLFSIPFPLLSLSYILYLILSPLLSLSSLPPHSLLSLFKKQWFIYQMLLLLSRYMPLCLIISRLPSYFHITDRKCHGIWA